MQESVQACTAARRSSYLVISCQQHSGGAGGGGPGGGGAGLGGSCKTQLQHQSCKTQHQAKLVKL